MKVEGCRRLVLILAALLLCCLGGCGEVKTPVDIIEMNAFHKENDTGDIVVYINWKNISRDKVIDALTLSVYCDSDPENIFECQVLEPDGVMPDLGNNRYFYTLGQNELPTQEITALYVSISEVFFTDGSTWENGEQDDFMLVEVDGHKGEGEFPAKLNAVHFYSNNDNPALSQVVYFQIDWTNISVTNSIVDVVYKISAKSSDGGDAVYFFRYYEPSEWVSISSDNGDKIYTDFKNAPALCENDAEIYEFCIYKVIDSHGIVWENSDSSGQIEISLDGKKGYAFDNDFSNASVRKLIDRIAEEAEKQGVDLDEPDVAVKDRGYCLLRYKDIDIRVELYNDNEVDPYNVRFICYMEPTGEELDILLQELREKMEPLRLCICAAALTELPYADVLQSVDDYNNNDKSSIEFSDASYKSFESVFLYKEMGEEALCCVFAAGRDFDEN